MLSVAFAPIYIPISSARGSLCSTSLFPGAFGLGRATLESEMATYYSILA